MALEAALPPMATTKDMSYCSTRSLIDEDPSPDDNFQLRLSDEEESRNLNDTNELQSEETAKETEEDILNKFEIDEANADNMNVDSEENLLDDEEDASNSPHSGKEAKTEDGGTLEEKSEKEISTKAELEPEKETKNYETSSSTTDTGEEVQNETLEDTENVKSKETIEDKNNHLPEDDETPKVNNSDCESKSHDDKVSKQSEVQEETKDVDVSEDISKDQDHTSTETGTNSEENNHHHSEDKDNKGVEGKEDETSNGKKDDNEEDKAEMFKRNMDTENLLDIVDVKAVDENSLLQEMKDASSSENSEKDENEEDCEEMDNDDGDKAEENEDEVENEETSLPQENDDVNDSIDIEENTLMRDDEAMEEDSYCDIDKGASVVANVVSDEGSERSGEDRAGDSERNESEENDRSADQVSKTLPGDESDGSNAKTGNEETNDAVPSSFSTKSVKRSINSNEEEEEEEISNKRMKLTEKDDFESSSVTPEEGNKQSRQIQSLNSLVEFMKSSVLTKLSRTNLEQLCLQKMCEAIMDKSEIGELRHRLKVQELMVEHWRKEVTQLIKQARDLETVNNRLMSDFRQRNERDKPIMPLKITRSVGLQVNPENFLAPNKKKPVRVNQSSPVKQSGPTSSSPPNAPASPAKTPENLPRKQTKAQVSGLPLINGLAAAENLPKGGAVLTECPQNSGGGSFIDLTDEDDRKAVDKKTNGNSTPVKVNTFVATKPNSNIAIPLATGNAQSPQTNNASVTKSANTPATTKSFRIVSPAVASGPNVSSAPRVMYVVNSPVQNIITTTSAVGQKGLLKVNANGIIGQNTIRPIVQVAQVNTARSPAPRPIQTVRPTSSLLKGSPNNNKTNARHPAPLPATPVAQISIASRKPIPPKPHLQIRKSGNAIVLSWKMPYNLNNFETIASYQLYAYQETNAPPSTDMWRKVGDIKALALPMACTLTQFADGNKYHFAVRAVDVLKRVGPFSDPGPILL